jgi:pectate lyase
VVHHGGGSGLSLASTGLTNATSVDETLAVLAKAMGGCGTGNPIDDCWRCDPNWRSHRQALANCAIGFGRSAIGGKNGPIYTVTSNGDSLQSPQPGTLRYGVTRTGPLWIIFARSMTIQLKGELWVTAFKTIDARGAEVHVTGTSQITIQSTHNVIVHGLHVHDIKPSGPSVLRASPTKVIRRGRTDGDGIHIWGSHDVWVDHCYLAAATDGLLDATRGSTRVTVSNCLFENHNKVMLFGASPEHTFDRSMRATVAYNKFGAGLIQRLPRCRFGTFHVVNNDYSAGWAIYAIGGSEDPTILSQGNLFTPSGHPDVTKHIDDGGPTFGGWQKWNWASSGDVFLKGSYFTGSGAKATSAGVYSAAYSASSRPGSMVPAMTRDAGPLN